MKSIRKAVIPAAGFGTRFLPATKAQPKEMLPIVDTPAIQYFIRQKSPRGLGDAVLCAKAFIGDEPFAVLLGDDIVYNPEKPCLQQLMDCYEQHPGIILGAQFVPNEKVSSYGIVSGEPLADNLYRVHGLVEKPSVDKAPSNLTPDIFDILENTKPGVGNEVQLTDALAASKTDTYALAYEGVRYDTGDKLGYLKATVEYALRNEELGAAFKEYLKGLKL